MIEKIYCSICGRSLSAYDEDKYICNNCNEQYKKKQHIKNIKEFINKSKS